MNQGENRRIRLVPEPKECRFGGGFLPWEKAKFACDKMGLPTGESVVCVFPYDDMAEEEHSVSVGDFGISILAGGKAGAKLAFQTLRQIAMQSPKEGLPFLEIKDKPDLAVRGFMLDISRCKVPNMQTLGYLVDLLALLKFNRLELYTEHTYAFAGHELVWAEASPMTQQDYAALGQMCAAAGLELVANLNSLGHMERWLRYAEYAYLAESKAPFTDPLGTVRKFPTTLYPDDKALLFMDSLYSQFLPNFASDKFNVGCDEPWELGMGRSRERCEQEGKYEVYLKHLLGLNGLCKKYGKKMYFWADVIMQKPEFAARLESGMTPVLWGYDYDHPFEEQCAYLAKLGLNFIVAPGTSAWNSFGLRLENALQNIESACLNAKKYGAKGALLTNWGDGGNHQPFCAMMPAILSFASAAWGAKMRLSEAELETALSALIYRDPTLNLARAVLDLGKIDPIKKQFCHYQKIFFADNAHIDEILARPENLALDFMEDTWRRAMARLAEAKPQAADGQICLIEVRLALDMIAWALNRAKNDRYISTLPARKNLKLICAQFGQVWLARARLGGLDEASNRIRAVLPEIFVQ